MSDQRSLGDNTTEPPGDDSGNIALRLRSLRKVQAPFHFETTLQARLQHAKIGEQGIRRTLPAIIIIALCVALAIVALLIFGPP